MAAQLFSSDKAFKSWILATPNGYVLNLYKGMSTSYLVLHKAGCGTLSPSRYSIGALTERSYRKVGGENPDALTSWLSLHIPDAKGFTKRCARCGA